MLLIELQNAKAIAIEGSQLFLGGGYSIVITMPIVHDTNTAIVPVSEIKTCNRLDAEHYVSGEHERICKG